MGLELALKADPQLVNARCMKGTDAKRLGRGNIFPGIVEEQYFGGLAG